MINQYFNKKIGAWVKVRRLKSGKTKILDVKENKPNIRFKL